MDIYNFMDVYVHTKYEYQSFFWISVFILGTDILVKFSMNGYSCMDILMDICNINMDIHIPKDVSSPQTMTLTIGEVMDIQCLHISPRDRSLKNTHEQLAFMSENGQSKSFG